MCLTNFDNVNTTHCFLCKQRNLGELCITRAKSQTRICAGIREIGLVQSFCSVIRLSAAVETYQ